MSKRATIKDIAQMLNISTSTVSRSLADRWDVNPETRKAVLEIAEQLNYHPNPISLSLRKQQTFTVGVVLPEFVNYYFAEVMIGIQSVLLEKGYNVLVAQSNESFSREEKNINIFESNMVDGFIISIAEDSEGVSVYEQLINKGFPLVFFNRAPENLTVPKVIVDDRKWAYNATEHLILQGCKRIAHFSGRENLSVSRNRKQGYLDALKKYKMPIDDKLIIECGLVMEKGVIGALNLLKLPQLPDGLFVVTDPVAIGAMKTLQKHGVRIPEDIAIVSFSESPVATIIEPNLTSVQQPTYEIGVKAAELLIAQINDNNRISQTIILDAALNIRESSLCKQYR